MTTVGRSHCPYVVMTPGTGYLIAIGVLGCTRSENPKHLPSTNVTWTLKAASTAASTQGSGDSLAMLQLHPRARGPSFRTRRARVGTTPSR